ncbi:hypothetical protein [Polynucleobacter sinensis]|uniref:hypothetical protein n=1 Tax=Polynucleobacter sinensis TaxID=1743157 RepID=UPI0012E80F15|nr:hypothetical protein [Polynucleobacter sinensis]
MNIDYRAFVHHNGIITIPTIGTVPLIGVKASQAEGVVRIAIGKVLLTSKSVFLQARSAPFASMWLVRRKSLEPIRQLTFMISKRLFVSSD